MLSTCAAHSRTHSTQKTPIHSGAHRDDTSKIGALCSEFRGAHSSTLITSQHATASQCTTRYHQSVCTSLLYTLLPRVPPVNVHVSLLYTLLPRVPLVNVHVSLLYTLLPRCYHEYPQSMCTTAAKARHVQREKRVYYASIVRRMGFASTRQTKKDWVMCGTCTMAGVSVRSRCAPCM